MGIPRLISNLWGVDKLYTLLDLVATCEDIAVIRYPIESCKMSANIKDSSDINLLLQHLRAIF